MLELKKKYEPENLVRERLAKETRTPEELWEIAQMEDDPYGRINYYRKLVEFYPENQYAPQALFMIGFVYAEELKDFVQARRTFNELIGEYPDNEVVESAKWMIDNMANPHPKFESLENMQERMQEDKETEDN
jgi:outer membrane protein assembly factor BamD (BamD/ComL family)